MDLHDRAGRLRGLVTAAVAFAKVASTDGARRRKCPTHPAHAVVHRGDRFTALVPP